MKILYISTLSFADCDFPLIREYQRKGIDVTYLLLLPPFALKSTLVDIKKQISVSGVFLATEYTEFKKYDSYMDMNRVYVANRTGMNSLSLSYWKYRRELYQFVKKGRFDIIHCDYMLGNMTKLLSTLTKRWVQTIHDPFPHTGEKSSKKDRIYRKTISCSNYFFLLNEAQKSDFCNYYNIQEDRVFTNRLGIYDNIKSFVKPSLSRKRNNVLFLGRISPYKGIEYLCEAIKIVKKHIPDVTLTIAGGGKIYFDIEPYLRLGGVELLNHYVGMEELAELLGRCEFTVCPYTDATQSGVIMTSYSLAKPVIATNVGGLPEMIEEGKTGVLIPPKDSTALALAIINLLGNRESLNKMSRYIETEFEKGSKSWDRIATTYINTYKNILSI